MTMRYVRSETTLWRSAGVETLLAAPGRRDVDSLSETATAVWEMLETARTLNDLVAQLSERYSVPRHSVEPHVRALLEQLVVRGWVTVDDVDT